MEDAESGSTEDDDEELDLLDELSEDNGVAWRPADVYGEDPDAEDDPEMPRGIQGTITYLGEVEKDQKYGGGYAPLVEITEKDGETIWSVRGYHGVLAGKIERFLDQGMKVGDFLAIKYCGMKSSKNDNDYHNYAAKFVAR